MKSKKKHEKSHKDNVAQVTKNFTRCFMSFTSWEFSAFKVEVSLTIRTLFVEVYESIYYFSLLFTKKYYVGQVISHRVCGQKFQTPGHQRITSTGEKLP